MRATAPLHDEAAEATAVDVRPDAAIAAAQHVLGMVAGDLARAGFYASAQAVAAIADLIAGRQRPH